MQVGKLGAAARKTMRPFFIWWVARCFMSVGLWGFGPVGQICKCSKYTSVYMYTFVFICRILGIPWHTGEYPWRRPCPLMMYNRIDNQARFLETKKSSSVTTSTGYSWLSLSGATRQQAIGSCFKSAPHINLSNEPCSNFLFNNLRPKKFYFRKAYSTDHPTDPT